MVCTLTGMLCSTRQRANSVSAWITHWSSEELGEVHAVKKWVIFVNVSRDSALVLCRLHFMCRSTPSLPPWLIRKSKVAHGTPCIFRRYFQSHNAWVALGEGWQKCYSRLIRLTVGSCFSSEPFLRRSSSSFPAFSFWLGKNKKKNKKKQKKKNSLGQPGPCYLGNLSL